MQITIVIFKAFDKTNNESFIHGETWEQIHQALSTICNTYQPLHILQSPDAEPVSLNVLDKLNS